MRRGLCVENEIMLMSPLRFPMKRQYWNVREPDQDLSRCCSGWQPLIAESLAVEGGTQGDSVLPSRSVSSRVISNMDSQVA